MPDRKSGPTPCQIQQYLNPDFPSAEPLHPPPFILAITDKEFVPPIEIRTHLTDPTKRQLRQERAYRLDQWLWYLITLGFIRPVD